MSLADKLKNLKPRKEWKPRPEVLLCPNTPEPLHGVVPREILGGKWWDATRKAAYESTDFHCIACEVHKCCAEYHQWLEGHELYNIDYKKGRSVYVETVPLCHYCHNYIHDGRLRSLLEQGKLHHAKFVNIITHGDRVLARAGLSRPTLNEREAAIESLARKGKIAPWNKWRLVLNGKLYPSRFESQEEYRLAMGR